MRHNEIIDTLQKLINTKPQNKKIAEIIGVKQTVINNRVARNSEYSYEEVKAIGDYYNVDLFQKIIIDQLLDYYKTSPVHDKTLQQDKQSEFINVEYYPHVYASCGNGEMVFNDDSKTIPVYKRLIKRYSETNKYHIIVARGDSMKGIIEENDELVVRVIENDEQILDNHIYVFSYCNDIYVKYLSKNIDEIIIKSANPEYKSKSITDFENLRIIGEIVGIMREV